MSTKSKVSAVTEIMTTIKILIVMDGSPTDGAHQASFGIGDAMDGYFGLSELLRTLSGSENLGGGGAPQITNFAVTKAHRGADPGDFSDPSNAAFKADFEDFKFDEHDLSAYDEIWLFGVVAPYDTTQKLTEPELQKIAQFMDSGRGVFATGDHEDLGWPMCNSVPRVRTMRKWYFDMQGNPGPDGAPSPPPALGTTRIDTIQPAGELLNLNDPSVEFDNQSDDVPQPIFPTLYGPQQLPHPLLSMQIISPQLQGAPPVAPIKILPDHMHEGEILEKPWTTTATLNLNGQSFVEYPKNPPGAQPLPALVAQGFVWPHATDNTENHIGDPEIANARKFGIIGAYDGHYANVGRVAVDSTWHHFFDLNLIGDPLAPPPKNQGFTASERGRHALNLIKQYYLNIATWLAPGPSLMTIIQGYVLFCRFSYPLSEILKTVQSPVAPASLFEIGAVALAMLRRRTNDTLLYSFLLAHLRLRWQQRGLTIPLPDPWSPVPGAGAPNPVPPPRILEAALGGGVAALARELGDISARDPRAIVNDVTRIVPLGIDEGLKTLGTYLMGECRQTEALADALQGVS